MDRLVPALLVLAVVLAVPTVALQAGTDDAGAVELAPHDGPNGEYATVQNGELSVDFDRLSADAVTRADRVFDVTATADEPVWLWITAPGATLYVGDDPDDRIDAESRAVRLSPGETVAVGVQVDTHGRTPGGLTLHVEPVDDTSTSTGSAGGGPPGDGPGDETATPTPTDTPATGTPTPGEAEFRVTDLTVADDRLVAGNGTTAVATVENVGDESGTYTARLRVDGTVVATQDVGVPAGETRTVSFEHVFEDAGTYTLAVGEGADAERATVTVVAPEGEADGNVSVVAVEISERTLSPGDATRVDASVRNTRETAAEVTLELTVAGTVVDARTVEVGAGETVVVSFRRTFGSVGVYPVSVNGVAGGEVVVTDHSTTDRLLRGSLGVVGGLPLVAGLLLALRRRRRRRRRHGDGD